jgi:2'-5' RNA ligase
LPFVMKRTRTFVAVEASAEVRAMAMRWVHRLQATLADVKWVSAENFHWTLQFLGDVDDLVIPEVCQAVAAAAAEHEVFSLSAEGLGVFPNPNRPRTIWIGVGSGEERLVALQGDIERRLGRQGFRGENRRFVPHLTIGRCGRGDFGDDLSAKLHATAGEASSEMMVEEVIVFASRPARTGSVYEPLSRAPLAR